MPPTTTHEETADVTVITRSAATKTSDSDDYGPLAGGETEYRAKTSTSTSQTTSQTTQEGTVALDMPSPTPDNKSDASSKDSPDGGKTSTPSAPHLGTAPASATMPLEDDPITNPPAPHAGHRDVSIDMPPIESGVEVAMVVSDEVHVESDDEATLADLCLKASIAKPTFSESALLWGFEDAVVEDAYQASLAETR
jgi:hypothetical protein